MNISPARLAAVYAVVLCVGCSSSNTSDPLSDALDKDAFRCFTINEAARTVAAERIRRKTRQLQRIDRLLAVPKLIDLDRAKLRSERAVLMADRIESEFHVACADAYYQPGSTKLRESFEAPPQSVPLQPAAEAFREVLKEVPERLHPHGFDQRAQLLLAEASFQNRDLTATTQRSEDHLEARPSGLYSDNFKLLLADSLTAQNKLDEALAIYDDVARIRIGFEAHYARYRAGEILRTQGNREKGDAYITDVLKWARRSARLPLVQFLEGKEPKPPQIVQAAK